MSGALHTVALNPALDQTVTLDRLEPGEVNRATATRLDPGGKGINVASCLADHGLAVTAHGLLGRANSQPFEALFAVKGIRDAMVRVPGETRTNIKILETGGQTTDVNLPGFSARGDDLRAVLASLGDVTVGDLVVVSGSHPGGLPADASAEVTAALKRRGARVVLDVSGAPLILSLAAAAGTLPDVIKPNRRELEGFAGRPLDDRAALVAAARDLIARGIALVVVSLGAEGAIFVTEHDGLHAAPPGLSAGSTVGAGDAMVAGIAAALVDGRDLDGIARLGTAFAAGKLGLPGPHLPNAATIAALAAEVAPQPLARWTAGEPAGRQPDGASTAAG